MQTVDGFPVQDGFDWLPGKPDLSFNQWSYGKVVKLEVMDFYFNPRWITWKGAKTWVADFELFTMLISSWLKGDRWSNSKAMTKEEALDEYFEMAAATPKHY